MENPNETLTPLAEGLKLSDLLSEEGATFQVNFDSTQPDEDVLSYSSDAFKYADLGGQELVDEECYDQEPFEKIAEKMTDLLKGGKLKKRILREGYGSVMALRNNITIHYNAYLEYNDEPFDSTYLRKKPFTFCLGEGYTIPGLDVAVQSMKINEKAQFLIHPDLAYGRFGCMPRVPPDATVLFEVEVMNCVEAGACLSFPRLSEEEQNNFDEIYKYAHALCSRAKDLFAKGLIKQAIKEYNIAVSKLESCQLKNYTDQAKQQTLLLRLYTNLVVAHTKVQEPRRACTHCNKVYRMCKGTNLAIPAKVHFNHARSLIRLGCYDSAEHQLQKARCIEPQNHEITKEFIRLDNRRKESYNRELALSKAIFKNTEINREPNEAEEVTLEFRQSITSYCKALVDDSESIQYSLPDKLTKNEMKFVKDEVHKQSLKLQQHEDENGKKYYISKPEVGKENEGVSK